MKSAEPIWICGRHEEMNLTAGFRCRLEWRGDENIAAVRVAARTAYRLWVNGGFAGYGPVRAAHGHARVDEWNITARLRAGTNVVALEVNALNVPCYATTDERPFVQAELLVDNTIVAATGSDKPWDALVPSERLQRVQRLSRQRGFAEAYRLTPASVAWRTLPDAKFVTLPTERVTQPVLLPRRVPYPRFERVSPIHRVATGSLSFDVPDKLKPWEEWLCRESGGGLTGYPRDQWEVDLTNEVGRWRRAPGAGSFRILDFGVNQTGFLRARVHCSQPVTLYLVGDEYLTDGDVDCRRLEYMAGVRWELAPGSYDLESFEVFVLRYLKVVTFGGGVEIEELSLREYVRPTGAEFAASDSVLGRIFAAADRTFAANAVDVFMDCPSRERAGWLCDSFFTGRVEPLLTGGSDGNALFIENYANAPALPDLPPGMMAKCYPGDGLPSRNFPPGTLASYIPNWPLWLVLQVAEFQQNGGDARIVAAMEHKIADLFRFFANYRNSDGLLEKLDKWVFVSWDDSNKHVQDVNYPTNMLYAAALEAAGRLYGRHEWIEQTAAVREQIHRQSWDGQFFVDNAMRDATGQLALTGHHTEACQYYAFFCGVATPKTHPELWRELVEKCSLTPGVAHPELPRAGALPAQHLRMILLSRYGETRRLVCEIRDGFLPMADLTGTLWEHEHSRHSCNHGFASHVAHLMVQDVLGVTVDWRAHSIRFRQPDNDLTWCRARIPLGDSALEIGWERNAAGARVFLERLPADWKFT